MAAPGLAALLISVTLVSVLLGASIYAYRATHRRRRALEQLRIQGWSAISGQSDTDLHVRVSAVFCDVLQEHYACNRVAVLRNLPSGMELQAASGVRFERPDTLRFVPSSSLSTVLSSTVSTFDLVQVGKHLPPQTIVTLRDAELTTGCCIRTGDSFAGCCFFAGPQRWLQFSLRRALPDFMPLLVLLWNAATKSETAPTGQDSILSEQSDERTQLMTAMFRAIRFRHADTLVKKLVTMIQKQMKLNRMAFVFASNSQVGDTHVIADGLLAAFELPTGFSFSQAFGRVSDLRPFEPIPVAANEALPPAIEHRLQACGITHLMPLPLSSRRVGVLAWNDQRATEIVSAHLETLFLPVSELVENAETFETLQELSYTDPLTGLANQRYFHRRLREELTRANRYNRSLAFILIDLDDLKVINDRYGHQAGDDVLRRIGGILKNSVRSMDVVIRYGGDEFGIIMPETGEADCERFMARVQKTFATEHLLAGPRQEMITYHLSMGGAVSPKHGSNSEHLVFAADMALLKAKETGRNTWKLFSPELLPSPGARR